MLVRNTLWGPEEIVETRVCRNCEKEKPLSEMESDRPHTAPKGKGFRNQCVECREHIKRVINKIKKEYAFLKPSISDCCILCGESGNELQKFTSQGPHKRKLPWVCDHDHKTDKFRGWICFNCNTGLSNAKDNIKTLENWIEYLKGNIKN